MRPVLPLLAALGCTPAAPGKVDDTAPAADDSGDTPLVDPCTSLPADDPCCQPRAGSVIVCADQLPWDTPIRGSFAARGGDGEWTFGENEGGAWDVDVYGDAVGTALVGDLAALGEVLVTNRGGCGWDGEGATGGTFEITDLDGAVLLVVGTGMAGAESPVTATWTTDLTSCPARPVTGGCSELVHHHPMTFGAGGASLELYQGQQGALGGLEVRVLVGEIPAGETYCDDAIGGGHDWVARPAGR